jgi:hypothetical protein
MACCGWIPSPLRGQLDRHLPGNAIALQSRIGAATFTLMSAFDSREPRIPLVTSFSGLPATLVLRVVAPA